MNLIDFILATFVWLSLYREDAQHRIAYIGVEMLFSFFSVVEFFFIFSACQKRRRRIKGNKCSRANRQSIPNHSYRSNWFLCVRYTRHTFQSNEEKLVEFLWSNITIHTSNKIHWYLWQRKILGRHWRSEGMLLKTRMKNGSTPHETLWL